MQPLWDKILAFLQTGQGMGIAGLLAIGVYLLYQNWGLIKTRFVGSTASTTPTRREALDYLDGCYNYFESIGCKEGMGLMREAITHAYHEHTSTTTDAITSAAEAIANALNPTTTS